MPQQQAKQQFKSMMNKFLSRLPIPKNSTSTQKSEEKTQNEIQTKQCRICLQDSSASSDPHTFIQPCKCSGSVKYVHQQCISEWISYTVSKKSDKVEKQYAIDQGVPCSTCKFPIRFQHNEKIECRKLQNLKEQIQKESQFFCLVMTVMLLSLVGIASISFVLHELIIKYAANQIDLTLPALAIAGIFLFFVFLGVGIFMLVRKFLLYTKNVITNIREYTLSQEPVQIQLENQDVLRENQQKQAQQSIHQLQNK